MSIREFFFLQFDTKFMSQICELWVDLNNHKMVPILDNLVV